MFQKGFFIVCFLFISTSLFSQETDSITKKSELPSSIYIKSYTTFLMTSYIYDLELKDFKFLIFDDEDLMRNSFTIDFRNIGRRGTKFSSQTYKDYDLYKHFPVVPDIISLDKFAINVDRGIY